MKRRYVVGVLSLAVAGALLLAACGHPSGDGSAPSGPAVSTGPEGGETSAPAGDAVSFTPGTWLSDAGRYYFFDENGADGRTASLEDGTGVGFSYTLDGARANFSMGAADNSSPCTVSREGDAITLDWEDGTAEHLTYVSSQGSDSFRFYSNRELADLGLAYYKANSGGQDGGELTAAAQTNDDGSVTIQVYENLGDHNSTAAWYTVDRTTAAGTDADGHKVELLL